MIQERTDEKRKIPWTEARRRVAIGGLVVDGVSGKAVGGVRIEIEAGPAEYPAWLARKRMGLSLDQRPDVTRTRWDGFFHFFDLPAGYYKLYGFLPRQGIYRQQERLSKATCGDLYRLLGDKRYGVVAHESVVADKDAKQLFDSVARLRLPPTGFRGRVLSVAGKGAVAMAQVRVKGSGESAFTDADGRYAVTGLEPDKLKRTVEVRARGHQDAVIYAEVFEAGKLFEMKDVELAAGRG